MFNAEALEAKEDVADARRA